MLTLSPDTVFTKGTGDMFELRCLFQVLHIADPHRFQSRSYRDGLWDGYWTLVDDENNFLTGLLPYVIRSLQEADVPFSLSGHSDEAVGRIAHGDLTVLHEALPYTESDTVGQFTLREYQKASVRKALAAQRGVIEVATGGGKTLIASSMIQALQQKALYLCGSTKILSQTVSSFGRIDGLTVGQVGAGERDTDADIVVSTVQSMSRMFQSGEGEHLRDRPVLFWDEAHHVGAETWASIGLLSRAQYRYGLSGTPFRGNGYDHLEDLVLTGLTGDRVVYVPSYLLRQWGFLAEPLITMVPVKFCPKVDSIKHDNDWHRVYNTGIVENTARNYMATQIAKNLYAEGHKVLVAVNRIEHGDNLLQDLPDAIFLKGGDAIRTLRDGQIDEYTEPWEDTRGMLEFMDRWIAVASPVVDEGVDIPSVTAIIILSGGKSVIKTIQRVGRGLRIKDGANTVLVFDFDDMFHGILKRHSKLRKELYQKERFTVETSFTAVNEVLSQPLDFSKTDWIALSRR